MSGHVFHPGHDELHGITVVVEVAEGRTLVGRWHEQTPRGVLLHDVAVHDAATAGTTKEEWLVKLRKFGIAVDLKHAIVPTSQLLGVRRLME
jgi:hypothetical protein